ncbi:MAG: tRNA(Ile)-lysidine synthase [Candidatus Dichloromethanomonas elyunquensis]|nr:MAG: tRNA(Ile)-lysidine synthase [Candidatus Dichloromethanomonas elyunquensis]
MVHDKRDLLKQDLQQMEKILIAFSGGVDSTFLLKIAHDVLGQNAVAVTVRSSAFPDRELKEARRFCTEQGIKHLVTDSEELDDPEFAKNPANRCYLCKKQLFGKLKEVAEELCAGDLAEGSNMDDLRDYRPGRQALTELGIQSPLLKAGLTKAEIRILSKELGLPTWDKPSFACLSSRIPYGEEITKDKLKMVEQAEQYLLDLGFRQVRVRHHGDIARIEVSPEEHLRFLEHKIAEEIYEAFGRIGFIYTALDLKGYRSGSMNEKIL